MKTLNLAGPGAVDLADRLVPALDGRVATVESLPETATRDTDAGAAYGLSTDGSWIGAGDGQSLDDLLDSLAPSYDYALTIGFDDARLPTVTLGGVDPVGTVVYAADDAETADTDAILDAFADVEPLVTLESLVQRAKASSLAERSGAIATFTGRVREKESPNDEPTTHLEFEKYEDVAADRMRAIRSELEDRDGVFEVLMHHRTGVITSGEDIVFVVVLAGHREEAFRTVEDGINRLKDEVPIFKKESTSDEEFWIHEQS
ncbi:molybdopterin synthase [Haloplanus halobius]|uniref:molybdopterin synthase n=1 Tax=Haloplanus halobius TaxID=2934938 RepID=UPI00200EA7A8|nr:molybdopterin synthase [Haloplanus sp. XH21]